MLELLLNRLRRSPAEKSFTRILAPYVFEAVGCRGRRALHYVVILALPRRRLNRAPSKAISKALTYRDHRRGRRRLHPLPFSLKTATGPAHLLTKNLFVPGVIFFSTFWLV